MYKKDLTLNNLQWLICHKTKPNQTKVVIPISIPSMSQIELFKHLTMYEKIINIKLNY